MLKHQLIKRLIEIINDHTVSKITYNDSNNYCGIYHYEYINSRGWENIRITFNSDDSCLINYSSSYCMKNAIMSNIEGSLIKGLIKK